MSRIRGFYVAQIILAVDEERTESTPPFEKIKENFDGLAEAIKDGLTGAMKSELGARQFYYGRSYHTVFRCVRGG